MGIPKKVSIYEVGPRDGLQNEKVSISTNTKVELINRLTKCNFKNIEIGSFVSPKWVPQMADSDKVFDLIKKSDRTIYPILTPNLKGLEKAIEKKVDTICVFMTASEEFSKRNTNCNVKKSMERVEEIVAKAKKFNIKIRGYLSCVLGCPYEGEISYKKTADLAFFLDKVGCYEISLGDTIGCGTPNKAEELIKEITKKVNVNKLAAHFHDTYGQALANLYSVLRMGVTVIDSSIAGLGGCPYAKGAKGNVATEDVLYMLNGMGVKTGINFKSLIETSWFISNKLGRKPSSRLALIQ